MIKLINKSDERYEKRKQDQKLFALCAEKPENQQAFLYSSFHIRFMYGDDEFQSYHLQFISIKRRKRNDKTNVRYVSCAFYRDKL